MRGASLLVLPVIAALPAQGLAATQGVQFNATVTPVCTLTVGGNGTMTPSADLKTLSSTEAGGQAGSVSLSTTGGVNVSVDPVTAVTPPPADVTATTWTPSYSVSGSHNVASTSLPSALNGPGSSTVTVHLSGTKGGSNTFTTGNYTATVTVRCE